MPDRDWYTMYVPRNWRVIAGGIEMGVLPGGPDW